MKSVLYVPFSNGDCVNGFKYEGNISEREYSKLMINEYKLYRDSIDEMVSTRYSKNMSLNPFQKQDNHYKQQDYSYNDCNCIVSNIKGNDADIMEIMKYNHTGEEFVLIFKLVNMSKTPDLETDIRMWIKESRHIENSNRLSDEEKFYNLPKKDFKIDFIESKKTGILKDCKLIEIYSLNEFAVMVNNIIIK